MSPLLAVSLFALASGSGGNLICRKMGMPRGWRRLFTLACTLVPPAGYLVLGGTAAVRGAVKAVRRGLAGGKKRTDEREDALRRMTPAERGMFLRREGMKEMKADLERSGARLDAARLRALARKERLLGRPGWDESSLFQDRLYRHLVAWEGRAAGAFAKDRERLQQYMMTTSVRERDTSQRVFSIRCNHLADGTLTFELPYDAGAEVLNEIRLVLARDWGVELGDYFRARVSEHPSNDFRCIGLGEVRTGMIHDTADYSVFVYDRGKGTVCPAGERLSPEIEKKVWKTMDDFKSVSKGLAGRKGILFDREALKSCLTLHTIGLDTVALAYNGIAVAYATAGRDGGIHLRGDGVPAGDRRTLKVASLLNEQLKGCSSFGEWVNRAAGLVLSADNIRRGAMALGRKAAREQSRERLIASAKRVLEMPVRKLKNGTKRH